MDLVLGNAFRHSLKNIDYFALSLGLMFIKRHTFFHLFVSSFSINFKLFFNAENSLLWNIVEKL